MAVSIAGRDGWSDETWSYLNDPRMPAMEHGWKLHVSARPGDLDTVTGLVLPVLSRHVCHAKFARDPETLRRLNSGVVSAGAVGKAITVYCPADTVVHVARELAGVLRDREGPRVVSDRRLDPRAPVYYRYGPFTGDYRIGRSGRLESVMTGPDGRMFDGLAVGRYRCPPWADDPFASGSAPGDEPSAPHFGGGRYTVTAGITRAPQGNVYRAVDRALGQPVVVKQARAFVGEDESGTDARHRLRNEHAVLTALDGVAGVPRALDYFAHQADEYLVMTTCGDRDLRREVLRDGPYRDDGTRPERTLSALASRLLRVLDAIHARNVVVRDLKPDNVVLDAAGPGHCHLIDFGISERDGTGPGGATPGYSAPVLRTTGPATPADDHYALGATLFFAATGMDPVIVDSDHVVNRNRTLACLAWALPGRAHREIRSSISGLLSLDPAVRTTTADRLRTGTAGAAGATRRPPPPRIDHDLLDEIIEHTTAFCVDEAHAIADPERAARLNVPTSIDVYGGSSGLGLELLNHLHRPRVRPAVTALARWTAEQSRNLPPAFYTGRTGVELFLAQAQLTAEAAGTHEETRPGHPALPDRAPDGGPPEADLIAGAAGTGLGRLLLARHAHRAGHSHAAHRHLAVAADCERMLASGTARLTPAGPDTAGRAALHEGIAHGEAGVACFLLEYGGVTGDQDAISRSERAAAHLAAVTPDIIAAATGPGATRRYGSWCRGLAGIGTVLVRAAERLDEPGYLGPARRAARACAALAPRMPLVTQCCGLAGVGELMVDVAEASGSEEFWDAAETTALLILSRSGGTWSRPVFPDTGLAGPSATWAGGSAGVLAFFRRLRDRGGPRLGRVT
ncbi:serine/threonine protein kinase [Streptomyces sp. SID8366]|uniref:class IV lanthionine synthetase LanL n=1 Tax=unclassified Streptomyces TaxID=2593676 RepID=UPI000DBA5861|nr:class IV lanthionine synthetase LanL [Streptomyces sp. PsTaAH-130]MYU05607.1 serine/threonine protein kinase [Streptomyces sp. SID8366]MYU63030.1 serine/threonine protein kinase [Streptomyces sp. SID69]RAJ63654.1 serine/threonine protein kinase [Streptomyces sp. PsTaAH-130]